jgi:hypothetical protein
MVERQLLRAAASGSAAASASPAEAVCNQQALMRLAAAIRITLRECEFHNFPNVMNIPFF